MSRYKFSLDPEAAAADDLIFTFEGMQDSKVVIDSVSLGLINGSTIDYVEEMMSSSFRVKDNPNSIEELDISDNLYCDKLLDVSQQHQCPIDIHNLQLLLDFLNLRQATIKIRSSIGLLMTWAAPFIFLYAFLRCLI